MWLPLALDTALLTSFLPIINKRLLADTDVSAVAWGVNAFSLPLLLLASVLVAPTPTVDRTFWFGIVASGILNLLATLISTQALKLGDASLVTPFLTFNPAFTLLIANFTLGESPSEVGIIGVLFIVVGGYLFNVEEARRSWWAPFKAIVTQRAVLFAIIASFIWGLTPIAEKLAIQHSDPENPPLVAFATTGLMSLMLFPLMLKRAKRPLEQVTRHRKGFAAAALIAGIAPLFGFTAINLGPVGYVAAIFKLSTVATVIWGALLLHEGGFRERITGSAVMVLGALLIAL
jgi:uncharacterized membrane protein